MTTKAMSIGEFLAPIWQEVSSLWSGTEFAFLDQVSYAVAEETPSAAFNDMTSASSQPAMNAGQYGHGC